MIKEEDKRIVCLYADNNMSVWKTSKDIFRSRTSVYKAFARVYKETGLDPMTFYDLAELIRRIGDGEL